MGKDEDCQLLQLTNEANFFDRGRTTFLRVFFLRAKGEERKIYIKKTSSDPNVVNLETFSPVTITPNAISSM